MNNLLKLIVPLLNDKISINDFSVESGFINAYTFDKNKPEIGYIYLMYDATVRNKLSSSIYCKFISLPEYKTNRIIHIKNKPYLLYIFSITKKVIRDLVKGLVLLDNNQKTRILQFWGFTDTFVQNIILNGINFLENEYDVPEEDYTQNLYEMFADKKSRGLVIETSA